MASKNYELQDNIVRAGGKYTFYGVLKEFYGEIFKNAKAESTRNSYNSIYNRLILPELTAERAIETYTLEDYEGVIDRIKEKGSYSEATIGTYRYLIRAVVRLAAAKDICEDVLFGTEFSIPPTEKPERATEKELVVNRKSLSAREEAALYDELMVDPMQTGEKMGLALMYCLGLRNEEACGLKYGAIRGMSRHPECFYAQIFQSINNETGEEHIGGKTSNMYRYVPVPDRLLWMINQRAHRLEEACGERVDEYYIACRGDQYKEQCVSRHLTAAGRAVLRKIHVNEDVVSYIDRRLHQDAGDMDLRVKDPTTYLLRRNLGTHLYLLGMNETEIQYIMGHSIEDPYIIRNHFGNEDLLYEIHQKMKNRPFLNDLYPYMREVGLGDAYRYHHVASAPEIHLTAASQEKSTLLLNLVCDEPCAEIEINAPHTVRTEVITAPPHAKSLSRRTNIIKKYHGVYKKATRHLVEG